MKEKTYRDIVEEFLSKTKCDRCQATLDNTQIMSIFNTDRICRICWEKEKKEPYYEKAVDAEQTATANGEWNFMGIDNK